MTEKEQLRELLIEEKERTHARVTKLEGDLDSLTRARRSESDDDEHDPEGETLSAQWSMRMGVLESARSNEQQVDAALVRFESGDFGVCVTCRHPIPFAQLEARPFREQCVACAS